MNKVKCPICGREHSVTRKDGELRQRIHCRCRDWSGSHTVIWWLAGTGYHYTDEKMNLVSVLEV